MCANERARERERKGKEEQERVRKKKKFSTGMCVCVCLCVCGGRNSASSAPVPLRSALRLTLKPVLRSSLRKRKALEPVQNWPTSDHPSTSPAAFFISVFFATTREASSGMSPLSFSISETDTPLKEKPTTAVDVSNSDFNFVTTSCFLSLVSACVTCRVRLAPTLPLELSPPTTPLFPCNALILSLSLSLSLSPALSKRSLALQPLLSTTFG